MLESEPVSVGRLWQRAERSAAVLHSRPFHALYRDCQGRINAGSHLLLRASLDGDCAAVTAALMRIAAGRSSCRHDAARPTRPLRPRIVLLQTQEGGTGVDSRDSAGRTALMLAARRGHLDALDPLIPREQALSPETW